MRNYPMKPDITPYLVELEKRIRNIEQRSIGSVYVTETIIAKDPNTGVETIFGDLTNVPGREGNGLQQWVGDVEPPPVPSEPMVQVSPGIFSVIWDGSNAGLLPGAPDFSHVNVYGSNGTSSLLVGVLKSKDEVAIISTADYGESWTFWLTAVDMNGNESLPSASSPPVQLIPMVESPDIVGAINDIYEKIQEDFNQAMDSADGKNSLWHTPTAPVLDPLKPFKDGDTWFDISKGNKIMKWVLTPAPPHWEAAVLDAEALDNAVTDAITEAQADATTAQQSADGKNSVWYRATAPTAPTGGFKIGDTWFDTANGNRINNWNGSAWIVSVLDSKALADAINNAITKAQGDASTAQVSANGKNSVWYAGTAPTAPTGGFKTGDTWFNTAKDNQINRWSGSAWVVATLGTQGLSTAVNTAITNAKTAGDNAQIAADQVIQDLADAEAEFDTQILATNNSVVTAQAAAATDAKSKADAAQAAAISAAATTAQLKADGAKADAIAAAELKAKQLADAAEVAALNAAKADATAKADAAKTAAINAAATDAQTKADAVKVIADAAAQAASDAAGIANGKGKVLVQSTAPGVADRNTNTLWIDTTGGANTPKKWTTGTTWIAVTDKAATDAATAAANAKTAADAADAKAALAQTAAGAAQGTADSALTMAGSKSNVFYSTAVATGTGTRVDDIWRQRDATNQIIGEWRWTGSAWQKVTLTSGVFSNLDAGLLTAGTIQADRIGAQSIVASKIKAKELTANEIKAGTLTSASGIFGTLDASVINAGTLSADRLNAGDIRAKFLTAGKITATDMVTGTITTDSGIIGSLDAGKITVGEMDGKFIKADTIAVDKLLVGSTTNMFPDPLMKDVAVWNSGSAFTNYTDGYGSSNRVRVTAGTGQTGTYYALSSEWVNKWTPLIPGRSYRMSVWIRPTTNIAVSNLISVYHRLYKTGALWNDPYTWASPSVISNNPTTTGVATLTAATWVQMSGVVKVPDDSTETFYTPGFYLNAGFPTGSSVDFSNFTLTEMASGELIVDGAVSADKIAANSITATNGKIASLDAGKITYGEMDGKFIKANTILAKTLAIQDFTNLLPNLNSQAEDWSLSTGVTIIDTTLSVEGKRFNFPTTAGAQAISSGEIGVLSGEKIKIEFNTYGTTASNNLEVCWFGKNGVGASAGSGVLKKTTTGNESVSVIWEVPSTVATVRFNIRVASGNLGTTGAYNFTARKMTGSVLIEDGAITALKIKSGELDADKGVIGSLDAGKITVGKMNGKYIESKTIAVDQLLVGSTDNLITDPEFTNTANEWGTGTGISYPLTEGIDGKTAMKMVAASSQKGLYSQHIPVSNSAPDAQETFRVSVWVKSSKAVSAGNAISIYGRSYPQGSSTTSEIKVISTRTTVDSTTGVKTKTVGQNAALTANVWTLISGEYTAPLDSGKVGFGFYVQSGYGSGTVWFSNAAAYRMGDGNLVVDGSITGDHIHVNTLDAVHIKANAIEADKIKAGSIRTTHLAIGGGSEIVSNGSGELGTNLGFEGFTRVTTDLPPDFLYGYRSTAGQGITNIQTGDNVLRVKPNTSYHVSVWVKANKAGSKVYLQPITGGLNTTPPYPFNAKDVPTTWTYWSGKLPETDATFLTNNVPNGTMYLRWFVNHPSGTVTDSVFSFTGLSIQEMTTGSLIVDGAIDGKIITAPLIQTVDTSYTGVKLVGKAIPAVPDTSVDAPPNTNLYDEVLPGIHAWGLNGSKALSITGGSGVDYIGITGQPLTGYGPNDSDGNPTEILGELQEVAVIDGRGGISGQSLSISGESHLEGPVIMDGEPITSNHGTGLYGPTISGKDLLGASFVEHTDNLEAASDTHAWMTPLPFGMVSRGYRDIAGYDAHSRERALSESAWEAIGGRAYRLTVSPFGVYASQGVYAQMNIYSTTDGSRPTMASNLLHSQTVRSGTTIGTSQMQTLGGSFYVLTGSSYRLRFLITLSGNGGNLLVYNSSAGGVLRYWVEDMGLSAKDSGTDRNDSRTIVNEVPAAPPVVPPADPTPAPPPPKTYVKTYGYSWHKNYNSNGSAYSSSSINSKAVFGRSPYYTTGGEKRSHIGFSGDIAGDIGSGTVTKVEVYVYTEHWHYNSGGTLGIGTHNNRTISDAATSVSGSYNAVAWNVKKQAMKKPEGRWITLPTDAKWKAGTLRGIILRAPGYSTSATYYGYAKPGSTKLRITFKR